MMKYSLLITFLFLTSCQLINEKNVPINAVQFNNQSAHAIKNVTLSVQTTHGRVSCSVIEANNSCGTGFPAKSYSGEKLTVSWTNLHNKFFEQQIILQQPTVSGDATHYKLTLLLNEYGQVGSKLNPMSY